MNYWKGSFLLAAGMLAGYVLHMHARPAIAHAQETSPNVGSCAITVPKEWGEFKGASDYGLTFEDDKGTLRFVLHPRCAISSNSGEAPRADWDLQIRRN